MMELSMAALLPNQKSAIGLELCQQFLNLGWHDGPMVQRLADSTQNDSGWEFGVDQSSIRVAHIIVIPFCLFNKLKPVTFIEAIGCALTQCADANGFSNPVSFRKGHGKYRAANTQILTFWSNIQMIQQQALLLLVNNNETDSLSFLNDVTSLSRSKC
jgi:hypothetical protein